MGRAGMALVVVLGGSACPHREAEVVKREEVSSTTTTTTTTTTKTVAKPVGKLGVELRGVVSAEGIGLSVRASEEVELAASVQLVTDAGAPQQVLTLRLDCKSQGCVKLAAGAELLAPAWLERVEGERCDALFRPPQPGQYRLRVQSCDGARQAEAHVRWAEP